jgi:hypothetical protein
MCEEGLCMNSGYISCTDAINFCDTDEYLTCAVEDSKQINTKPLK